MRLLLLLFYFFIFFKSCRLNVWPPSVVLWTKILIVFSLPELIRVSFYCAGELCAADLRAMLNELSPLILLFVFLYVSSFSTVCLFWKCTSFMDEERIQGVVCCWKTVHMKCVCVSGHLYWTIQQCWECLPVNVMFLQTARTDEVQTVVRLKTTHS